LTETHHKAALTHTKGVHIGRWPDEGNFAMAEREQMFCGEATCGDRIGRDSRPPLRRLVDQHHIHPSQRITRQGCRADCVEQDAVDLARTQCLKVLCD